MKKLSLISFLLLFAGISICQTKTEEVNDERAKVILEELKTKIDAYSSLEIDFNLEVEIPEAPKQIKRGNVIQKKEKYKLDLNDQIILSDGISQWVYIKSNNEVQINTVDNSLQGINTPMDFITIYERKDFLYALTNEGYQNGKAVQQIEFKPTDRNSEYAKIRLSIDKKLGQVMQIKAFIKDGSRYTFQLTKFAYDKPCPDVNFIFDASKYEGVYIEDLRID